MGSSGGGGDGDTRSEIRYAPYVEEKHSAFLTEVASNRIAAVPNSPFTEQTDIIVDDAFFGANYIITSYPTLYDMFGKFEAGLDIEELYHQEFEDTVNSPEVNNLVQAESALLQDEIDINIAPGYELGARNINSVNSEAFVNGLAVVLGDAKIKSLNKFSAELRYRLISVAVDRWKTHLSWNQQVVTNFSEIMKFYYATRMDVTDFNTSMGAKDTLWPFTVLEYERAALGALQGARNSASEVGGTSKTAKVLSGVLGGAAAGASLGWPGAAAGALLGGIGSIF